MVSLENMKQLLIFRITFFFADNHIFATVSEALSVNNNNITRLELNEPYQTYKYLGVVCQHRYSVQEGTELSLRPETGYYK